MKLYFLDEDLKVSASLFSDFYLRAQILDLVKILFTCEYLKIKQKFKIKSNFINMLFSSPDLFFLYARKIPYPIQSFDHHLVLWAKNRQLLLFEYLEILNEEHIFRLHMPNLAYEEYKKYIDLIKSDAFNNKAPKIIVNLEDFKKDILIELNKKSPVEFYWTERKVPAFYQDLIKSTQKANPSN